MKAYLFPFGKIKKNARIALYAAGAVGRAYHEQLRLTEYAKVVLWVDKRPKYKGVVLPDDLIAMDKNDFDFVLIAVEQEELAKAILTELIMLGVDECRIIYTKPIICSQAALAGHSLTLTLDELLAGDHERISGALKSYSIYANGDTDYFSGLKNMIIAYTGLSQSRKKEVQDTVINYIEHFDSLLTSEEKAVLLRLLYESGCFFGGALRMYLKNIHALDSGTSQQYWLFVDIVTMWFNHPEALFDELFSELRDLGKKIALDWDLKWKTQPYEYKNNKRICLMLPYLRQGALPTYFSPIVAEFVRRGYEVHILDIEFTLYDGGADFLKPLVMSNASNLKENAIMREFFPDSVVYHYAGVRNVRKRQEKILSIISDINPFCVLDASVEAGIVSYYIFQKYPVINVPIRKSGYASTFFHKVILYGKDTDFYPPINAGQVIRLPSPFEKKEPQRIFARAEYGLGSEDIVCITVGARLSVDIHAELFCEMCDIMLADKRIKWIIVGAESLPYICEQPDDVINESVRFIGWESDLVGLYQICDVYVNPPRVGGGTTIVWAAQSGLAIVTPKDAAAGRTLVGGANCVESEDDIAPRVVELANNPTLLAKQKEEMKELSLGWSIERYMDKLEMEMLALAEGFEKGAIKGNEKMF